jgi:hypothetical protein
MRVIALWDNKRIKTKGGFQERKVDISHSHRESKKGECWGTDIGRDKKENNRKFISNPSDH